MVLPRPVLLLTKYLVVGVFPLRLFLSVLFAAALLVGQVSAAQDGNISLNAKAFVVGHPATGKVLATKNGDVPLPPASLTKLMTAYMLFEALKNGSITLETEMAISEQAWRKEGSKMFVEVGKTVKVADLIPGILTVSGNDACMVVAEHLGGTEANFATMMTNKAEVLGLKNTEFKNSNGWPDEGHLSTAQDMFTLASRLIRDFPEYYHYFSQPEFTFNNIRQYNRNGLLRAGVGVDGLKTGHVEESGYHIVASAQRDGQRYVAVVFGTESFKQREGEALAGLNWAFANFKTETVLKAGTIVEPAAATWLGDSATVPLVATKDVQILLNRNDKAAVKAELVYSGPIAAPIAKGTEIGRVVVSNTAGEVISLVPVVAGADVAQVGLLGRIATYVAHSLGF